MIEAITAPKPNPTNRSPAPITANAAPSTSIALEKANSSRAIGPNTFPATPITTKTPASAARAITSSLTLIFEKTLHTEANIRKPTPIAIKAAPAFKISF